MLESSARSVVCLCVLGGNLISSSCVLRPEMHTKRFHDAFNYTLNNSCTQSAPELCLTMGNPFDFLSFSHSGKLLAFAICAWLNSNYKACVFRSDPLLFRLSIFPIPGFGFLFVLVVYHFPWFLRLFNDFHCQSLISPPSRALRSPFVGFTNFLWLLRSAFRQFYSQWIAFFGSFQFASVRYLPACAPRRDAPAHGVPFCPFLFPPQTLPILFTANATFNAD